MSWKFFLSLFSLFTVACQAKNSYSDIALGIVKSYSKEISQQECVAIIGTGGSMTKDVKTLYLHVWSENELEVSEARRMYLRILQGLVDKVNANEEVRPYLHDYPFTWKNIDLDLGFHNDNGWVGNEKVALVTICKGEIFYKIYDQDDDGFRLIYREPYEEALRIVYPNQ